MDQLKEELQKSILKINDLEKLRDNIEMTVTAEGLRIELLESERGTFFDSGHSDLNGTGKEMVELLAQQLGQLPNHISVEGHTDAKPYTGGGNYDNWELSADRANAARRLMQESGLRADQISQVRGFADQRLHTPQNPLKPSNRRVSIIVQYLRAEGTDDTKLQPEDAGTPKTSLRETHQSSGRSEPAVNKK